VSFCVLDQGQQKEGHWSWYFKSVIVFGKIRTVEDPDRKLKYARLLARKYMPTEEEVESEIAGGFSRMQMLELVVEHMTGKRVHEQ